MVIHQIRQILDSSTQTDIRQTQTGDISMTNKFQELKAQFKKQQEEKKKREENRYDVTENNRIQTGRKDQHTEKKRKRNSKSNKSKSNKRKKSA